ncbi:heterokaryon incompatibility protein-domain-containing protein [Rhexocercosporidium sp. MPI-PUGE-AT-0058]|nr:heterokaryon incompatibility protein-domain-containing protein [Rhexocercosporidium sp. MPI-PUGE-AT-0058]
MDYHSPRKGSSPIDAGLARTIAIDSTSEECWAQITTWIQECGRDHFLCGSQTSFMAMPITSSHTLPRRVVDIGEEGDNSNIRLFESNFSSGVYLALSHAWGNHLPIKTTTKTIKRWKKNIPWTNLSKTFKDAVLITRKLGVRYLWIDTLCIIQDDKRDWEIEAANMAKIYQDALLVLSATLSADGTGGCFSQRTTSTDITAVNSDGTETKVFVRERLPHQAFGHSRAIYFQWDKNEEMKKAAIQKGEKDLVDHPVLQRAWCFQERLLARRTLHYTKNELVWECVQTTHCECGMLRYFLDDNNSIRRHMNTVRFDQGDPRMNVIRSDHTPWYLPEVWSKILGQYSCKRLGYATDTLPALAGLASRLASGNGMYLGKYMAGLWERDIDSYIVWMPMSKEAVRPRDRTQCSYPSWSWASIDTPFYWPSWGDKETTLRCFAVTGNDIKGCFEDIPDNNHGLWNSLSTALGRPPKPKTPVVTVTMGPNGNYSMKMPAISYSKWTGGSLFLKGMVIEVVLIGIDDSQDIHAAVLERDGIECVFAVDRREQCLELVGCAVHLMRLTQVTPPKVTSGTRNFAAGGKLPDSLAFVLLQIPGTEGTFRRIGMLKNVPDEWIQYEGDEFEEFELL